MDEDDFKMEPAGLASSSSDSDVEELAHRLRICTVSGDAHREKKKALSRHLLMREAVWERRRKRTLSVMAEVRTGDEAGEQEGEGRKSLVLTDDDLEELKGSIELGFGFNEEEGSEMCETLPALDLYFAVKRQLSDPLLLGGLSSSPVMTPRSAVSSGDLSSGSPPTPINGSDPWKICSPGDNPKEVKTRLRHWAQAVACSVKQISPC